MKQKDSGWDWGPLKAMFVMLGLLSLFTPFGWALLYALVLLWPYLLIGLICILGLVLPVLLYRRIRTHRLLAAASYRAALRWWIWGAYIGMFLLIVGVIIAQRMGIALDVPGMLYEWSGMWWLPPMLVALLPAWLRYRTIARQSDEATTTG